MRSALVYLATQAAQWRRLIEFLALRTLRSKTTTPASEILSEDDASVSDYEDSEEAIHDIEYSEDEIESVPSEGLSALAKYTHLDDLHVTKHSPVPQTKDSPYDKIPVGRRNGSN